MSASTTLQPRAVGGLDAIEDHARRIPALDAADDLDVAALGPHGELFGRCGAEGVAGGHQHRVAFGFEPLAQLADRGGLADTVHPDEQPDVGLALVDRERTILVGDLGTHALLEQPEDGFAAVDLLLLRRLPHTVEQLHGGQDADVGPDQRLFEVFPRLVVERPESDEAAEEVR